MKIVFDTEKNKELEMWFNYCAEKRFFDES